MADISLSSNRPSYILEAYVTSDSPRQKPLTRYVKLGIDSRRSLFEIGLFFNASIANMCVGRHIAFFIRFLYPLSCFRFGRRRYWGFFVWWHTSSVTVNLINGKLYRNTVTLDERITCIRPVHITTQKMGVMMYQNECNVTPII